MGFVILSYVGTSLIIKLTFSDEEQDLAEGFNKPMFISYTACASFSIYSLKLIYEFIKNKCKMSNIEDMDMKKIEFKTALI